MNGFWLFVRGYAMRRAAAYGGRCSRAGAALVEPLHATAVPSEQRARSVAATALLPPFKGGSAAGAGGYAGAAPKKK